jgi:hypothetical protein
MAEVTVGELQSVIFAMQYLEAQHHKHGATTHYLAIVRCLYTYCDLAHPICKAEG